MNIEQARFNMIEQQIRPWDVYDYSVLDLFQSVPREAFVKDQHQGLAFADMELPIWHDQVMMSPKVEARMLQALNITPDDNILEIGTGSGFITACLAKLGKHVTTYEYFQDLSEQAGQRLQRQQIGNVDCLVGDIFSNQITLSSYHAIVITGSIPQDVEVFNKHLHLGGRLFCIVGNSPAMTAKLFTCMPDKCYREQDLFETELPALLSTNKLKEFKF